MDKFKGAHEAQQKTWNVVGSIKRQRPKNFKQKLKKILQTAASNHEKKQHISLTSENTSKKLKHIVGVEVTDKSNSVSAIAKKKVHKRKQKNVSKVENNETATSGRLIRDSNRDNTKELEFEKFMYNVEDTGHMSVDTSHMLDVDADCGLDISTFESVNVSKPKASLTDDMISSCSYSSLDKIAVIETKSEQWDKKPTRSSSKKLTSSSSLEINQIPHKQVSNESSGGDENHDTNFVFEGKISQIKTKIEKRDDFIESTHGSKRKRSFNRSGRKRKNSNCLQNQEDELPLIIELEPGDTSVKVPSLLQNVYADDAANNNEDDIEYAIKLFYESLSDDAEISVAPEVVDPEVAERTFESDVNVLENDFLSSCEDVNVLENDFLSTYEEDNVSDIVVYKVPNSERFLLFMKHPNSVFFKGKLTVTVLMGCIEVLGCTMDMHSNTTQTLYSPKGSSMMAIETCPTGPPSSLDYEILNKNLVELGIELSKDVIADVEQRDCVVLLEEPTSSIFEDFLNTLPPEMHLFSVSRTDMKTSGNKKSNPLFSAEKALHCVFELCNSARRFKRYMKSPDWDATAHTVIRGNNNEPGCAMVCGGQGVGKSTFVRFLINQALRTFGEVLCLDFDPGQAEFTVPGCVSAVIVRQPLLGPNFTHLIIPECMVFVGEVNIAQCPAKYVDSSKYIVNFCNSYPRFKKMPWIVNTMGFAKGVGVDLTTILIRMLRPHHVVQIQSQKQDLNFPSLLSPAYIWQYQSTFYKVPPEFLQYTLHTMESVASAGRDRSSSVPWGLGAPRLREAMILSYLSQMLKPPKYCLTDVLPHSTPFCKMTLCVCHASLPYSQILSAMNGNLVALCSYNGSGALLPDDPELPSVLGYQPVCPCFGFGIVRGIDSVKKCIYVITPVSETILRHVNCLMLGAITLPSYIYIHSTEGTGQIPYVATGPGQPTSKVARRFFRPLQHVYGTKAVA